MMRRGPLAQFPIEQLLEDAGKERVTGVLEISSTLQGRIYLVEGDVYFADQPTDPPLEQRLIANGIFTQAQVDEHGQPGPGGVYLARALDTDLTIDEDLLDSYLLDVTAISVAEFLPLNSGEYELDPYGNHPAGVLTSWSPGTVLARIGELQSEAERRLRDEQDRLVAEEAERARWEAEEAEQARIAQEEAERAEREEAERARLEEERLAAEEAERVRREAEEAEHRAVAEVERQRLAEELAGGPPLDQRAAGGLGDPLPLGRIQVPIRTPRQIDKIELEPIEWQVLIRGSHGADITHIADALSVSVDTLWVVIEQLWQRGLVGSVAGDDRVAGAGQPPPVEVDLPAQADV